MGGCVFAASGIGGIGGPLAGGIWVFSQVQGESGGNGEVPLTESIGGCLLCLGLVDGGTSVKIRSWLCSC